MTSRWRIEEWMYAHRRILLAVAIAVIGADHVWMRERLRKLEATKCR